MWEEAEDLVINWSNTDESLEEFENVRFKVKEKLLYICSLEGTWMSIINLDKVRSVDSTLKK